jgi:GT2 family glycosyltransferase
MKTRVVIATTSNMDEFSALRATGRTLTASLSRHCDVLVYPENRHGLPLVYNDAIDKSKGDYDALIFCHDDVHFLDHFWLDRCLDGLASFELIGVAGAIESSPSQIGWCLMDTGGTLVDRDKMAGAIAHGKSWPPASVDRFGTTRKQVDFIDGVFMACRTSTLRERNLRFDERFDFHFYDLDFCKTASRAGASIGVWDIALMHESAGAFGSAGWQANYQRYIGKWNA